MFKQSYFFNYIKRVCNFNNNKKLLKIYLDYEMVFYDINFNNIRANFVFDEADFYNDEVLGLPTYLCLKKTNFNKNIFYPDLNIYRLGLTPKYGILSCSEIFRYSTVYTTTIGAFKVDKLNVYNND